MVKIRGVRCAIAPDGHILRGEGVFITNPKHVEFTRRRRKDFRPEDRVCAQCAKSLAQLYEFKLNRAREKRRLQSINVSSSSSVDDFDRIVYRTPQTKNYRDFVKQSAPFDLGGPSQELNQNVDKENQANNACTSTESSIHSEVSSISSINDAASDRAQSPPGSVALSSSTNSSQHSTLDLRPSTSAAAASTGTTKVISKSNDKQQTKVHINDATNFRKPLHPVKRKRIRSEEDMRGQQPSKSSAPNTMMTTTDDNDDFQPSLNALNGTRLPHIQPIPKRRQFQHVIPTVHDIYMQGITGG